MVAEELASVLGCRFSRVPALIEALNGEGRENEANRVSRAFARYAGACARQKARRRGRREAREALEAEAVVFLASVCRALGETPRGISDLSGYVVGTLSELYGGEDPAA